MKNFWHSTRSSGLNFVFLIFDFLNFKINVEWYFKIHFLDPDFEAMNHPLRHNPLLKYSVQRQNFLAAYFSGKQHVKGTLINQLGMEHHSIRFKLWLQELLFPALHMTAPHLEALRDVLTVYQRKGAQVLQAYTPQEDRLFREVLPFPTFRPEVSYRDAGLLRTSRNFILPCAHWMRIPSDFVGISQSGLMVLRPTLHAGFLITGCRSPTSLLSACFSQPSTFRLQDE